MNGKNATVAALGIGAIVCGIGLVAAPLLEPAQRRADRQALRHIEKARRLLAAYNPEADLTGTLLADLVARQVDVHFEQSQERVDDPEFQAGYEAVRDVSLDRYNARGDQRPKGGTQSQIAEGIAAHKKLLSDNTKILKDALAEADAALGISVGDATTRNHPAANRLRGAILYEQARAAARTAALLRSAETPLLAQFDELHDQVLAAEAATQAVKVSDIDAKLAAVDQEIAARDKELAALTSEWQALDGRVRQMEAQLAQARQTADAARQTYEDIVRRGQDFAQAQPLEQFNKEFGEQARRYQEAVREAQRIEFGIYPKAAIDQTGDYLRGRLVENGTSETLTAEFGLVHYQAERDRADAARKLAESTVADLREQRGRMLAYKESLNAQQQEAMALMQTLRQNAAELLEQLTQSQAASAAAESDAVARFTSAAQSFAAGLNGAQAILREAADRSREVAQASTEFSAATRISASGPTVYHLSTEQAEALAGAAWIHQQAFAASRDGAETVGRVAAKLGLAADAAKVFDDAATQAAADGRDKARKAADLLQNSRGQIGGHWTIAAELAGTAYLFVLFGDRGMLADVKANYRNALDGREDEAALLPIKERLDALEKR